MRPSIVLRFRAAAQRGALLAILALGLASCETLGLTRKSYEVPVEDTVQEQARIADQQERRARQTVDKEARDEELRKTLAALEKVVELFPNDRVYTPACLLRQGDILLELGEPRRAEAVYRSVLTRYPDIDDVRAGGLYGLGEALTNQERIAEGKAAYKQLIDAYGNSRNQYIRDRVSRARVKYGQIL